MALKKLLVAFTTLRTVKDENDKDVKRRVRFKSGSVLDLTDDEMATLDKLTKATGKAHYRDPINEGGKAVADEPEVVNVPDFAGQDVPMDKKTVDQLKAYLTFNDVSFGSEDKAGLLKLATNHAAGKTDLDGGL